MQSIESTARLPLRRVRVLRRSAVDAVETADADDAFELLIERWRVQAFELYAGIRAAQRAHCIEDVTARVSALCAAGEVARNIVDEMKVANSPFSELMDADYIGVAR